MESPLNKFYWLRIFISPVLVAGAIAFALWYNYDIPVLLIYIIVIIGAIVGFLFANWATKDKDAIDYMSEIDSTKDIMTYDEIIEEQKKNKNVE